MDLTSFDGFVTAHHAEIHRFCARVVGGARKATAAPIDTGHALGRCGPADGWKILGNIYTPQCMAHDMAVRTKEAQGTPHWLAQVEALPKLPAAIGSYVGAKLA